MDGLQVIDGVRVDGGGSGWGKSEKTPAWRSCWKAKHPLISFASLHFWKWAGNKSTRVKWKTGSTVFQKKKKQKHIEPEQKIPCWCKYKLIFAALYILQMTICECS